MADPSPWGLSAEFERADDALAAVRALKAEGYAVFDAYTPFPVPELNEEVAPGRSRIGLMAFLGGVAGLALSLWIQWSLNAVVYPLNVGGRPLAAWPAFLVPAVEAAILAGAGVAAAAFLALGRLPRLHHPIFNTPGFERVSAGRHFVAVERRDPRFDADALTRLFRRHGALAVEEVPE